MKMIEGAALRVRPKMMTVAVIIAGLLPIMLSHGTGSEVMQRIAAPMVGALEPYGVGLIRFSIEGLLPQLSRGEYGALSVLVLLGLLVVLWRGWRRIPLAMIVFPSLVLWFAWRSLQNYFSFAGLLALSGDEGLVSGESPERYAWANAPQTSHSE